MAKYNWEILKKEFLLGDYKSLREFAFAKNINYSHLRRKAKTWIDEKRQLEAEKARKIAEGVVEQQIAQEIDRNIAHLKAWDELLNIVMEALTNKERHLMTKNGKINIYALEKIANIIEKLQKGQRLALGLDEQQEQASHEELIARLQEIVGALNDDNIQH